MEANRFRSRAWSTKYNLFLAEVEIYSDGSFTAEYRREDGALVSQNMDECIVEQSTGLGDANGVEIFEGDVVRWGSEDLGGVRLFEIVFADGAFMGQTASGFFHEHPQHLGFAKSAEVIGNIHQNGDLLS